LGLFPLVTLGGFMIYTTLYLITHNSDLAAGIGMGCLTLAQFWLSRSLIEVAFMVLRIRLLVFPRDFRLFAHPNTIQHLEHFII
jgi:hypothetical protein